jgi:hypothetical protein
MEEAGGLPKLVVAEFEEFLKCGIVEEGCLHLVCRSCGYSEIVALSCKKRGFCPGCLGRRMAGMAVHLEERVLPAVPVRHWICSLPWGAQSALRFCGRHHGRQRRRETARPSAPQQQVVRNKAFSRIF